MNDMGDPLDHGFDEPEELREIPLNGEMEAGPSGTRRDEDDVNAHFSVDAVQLATVHEHEGAVRAIPQILCM